MKEKVRGGYGRKINGLARTEELESYPEWDKTHLVNTAILDWGLDDFMTVALAMKTANETEGK